MKIHCKYDELVELAKLKIHPKNRNKHSPEQVARLARILEYQGWRYAIKVSKRSGCITSGHGRLEAAWLRAWPTVPVVYQDYESDEQEYADVQADNAIASWAELDLAAINADLADLGPDLDIDMLGINGFTIDVAEKVDFPDLAEGEKQPFQQVTFMLHNDQAETVQAALALAIKMGAFEELNPNRNGNAISRICESFLTQNG